MLSPPATLLRLLDWSGNWGGSRGAAQGFLSNFWMALFAIVTFPTVLMLTFGTLQLPARSNSSPCSKDPFSTCESENRIAQSIPITLSFQAFSSGGEAAIAQGIQAYHQGQYPQAVEFWQQAVTDFQQTGNSLQQALVFNYLSLAFQALGQWQAADEAISQSFAALQVASVQDQTPAYLTRLARSKTTQAQLDIARGEAEKALQLFEEATEIYDRLADREGKIGSLLNQTQAFMALGRYHSALKLLQHIETQIAEPGPSLTLEIQAKLWFSLGNTYQEMGDLNQAWITLNQSLDLAKQLSDVWLQNQALISLGNVAYILGKRDQALQPSTIPQRSDLNEMESLRDCKTDLCLVSEDHDRALRFYRDALDLYQEVIQTDSTAQQKLQAKLNSVSVCIQILRNKDWKEYWQPEFDRALQYWQEIHSLSSASNRLENRTSVFALITLADQGWELQDFTQNLAEDEAKTLNITTLGTIDLATLEHLFFQAIDWADLLQDPVAQTYARGYLGHFYEHLEQWQNAQRWTRAAWMISEQIDSAQLSHQWQWQLGRISPDLGEDSTVTIAHYAQALDTLEHTRQDLIGMDNGLDVYSDFLLYFEENVEPFYQEFLDLLLTESSGGPIPQENLNLAMAVYELLQEAELEILLGCNVEGENAEAENIHAENIHSENSANELTAIQPDLDRQSEGEFIQDIIPSTLGLQLSKNVKKIQEKRQQVHELDPHTAILFPIVLDDRLALILSLPGSPLRYFSTPVVRSRIEHEIWKFRQLIALPAQDSAYEQRVHQVAQQLYAWLFSEVGPILEQSNLKNLIVVPDSLLGNIPLSALYDPVAGEYLLQKSYTISVTPNFLSLDTTRFHLNSNTSILAAGLTSQSSTTSRQSTPFCPSLPPLISTREEVEGIAQRFNRTVKLLDEDFRWKTFHDRLDDQPFAIVHIATHGEFTSTREGTVLIDNAGDCLNIDEFDELVKLQSSFELMILSACQTAQGDYRAALGLAGLAVKSRSKSTLATLFNVDDATTAELMQQFYQNLLHPGTTKTEALHQAQLELFRHNNSPAYWSPYVIVGNWR